MILQALYEYYQRKTSGDEAELAEPGFDRKAIAFVVVLDRDGRFVDLEDTRGGDGPKQTARLFTVPQGIKKTSGIAANLLWDNASYVLGVAKTADRRERTTREHAAFIQRVRELTREVEDGGLRAVLTFLEQGDFSALQSHPVWTELRKGTGNVSFRLDGDMALVCQRPAVIETIRHRPPAPDTPQGQCLVTGERDAIARLHPVIQGVWGAQPSGANIVSFNFGAAESFGKEQGLNAPVSQRAALAYTQALNHLLRSGSRQRMTVGDATAVFWAERRHPLETGFFDLMDEDDPDRHIDAVRSLLTAPHQGHQPSTDDGTRFFILGLAPTEARLAVRFWHCTTVWELSDRIRRHFQDLTLTHGPDDRDYPSLSALLRATALQRKPHNVVANMAGDTLRSVLTGAPYPRTLLHATLRRIRAESRVEYLHAALIKAILRRQARFYGSSATEVDVSLDEKNTNVGYRLGRLLAVLEHAQHAAQPTINTTIRDRFYASASATPVTVFPHLLKLNNHHLSKLENRGRAVNLQKTIAAIVDGFDSFPAHLSLEDQGRFAIGYYHQRQHDFNRRRSP